MWNLILKAAISYIEAHPEKVTELVGAAVDAAIHAIKSHNAAQVAVAK